MKPMHHWWRTKDGRLVPDGHLDADTLAYPRGHEIPDEAAVLLGIMPKPEAEVEPAQEAAEPVVEPVDDEPPAAKVDEPATATTDPPPAPTRRPADKAVRAGATKAVPAAAPSTQD